MKKAEIRNEIAKALNKGWVCLHCTTLNSSLVFAEPKDVGYEEEGYVEWFFTPYQTNWNNSHWDDGFKCFDPTPTGLSYTQICYRLGIDNPIIHLLRDSRYLLCEMIAKGKSLFNKKEVSPIVELEWDEDDIF